MDVRGFNAETKSVEQLFHEIVESQPNWNEGEEEAYAFPYDLSDMFNGAVKHVAHVNINGRNCLMWLIKKVGLEGAGKVGFITSANAQCINYHVIIEDLLSVNVGCVIPRYFFNVLSQDVLREAFETVETQIAR